MTTTNVRITDGNERIDVRLPPKSERLRPHRLRGWLVYPDPANEPNTCFGDPEGDEGLTTEQATNWLDWCDNELKRGKAARGK
jgi:hypothetical protein